MGPGLLLDEVLRLELHLYADEVGDVLDQAQKEDKMEASLAKLKVCSAVPE
jgi:dynein heavy chain